MDKFTKLNLNGVDKFVSAIYDGSGNDIESTYETKEDATAKETALSGRIDSTNSALATLEARVVVTEAYKDSIDANLDKINTNIDDIVNLKVKDAELEGSIGSLTIAVNNTNSELSTVKTNQSNNQSSILGLLASVNSVSAIVNDEASGINALNAQADSNTAEIAKVAELLGTAEQSLNAQYEALLARVVALETKMASYHPETEEPTE